MFDKILTLLNLDTSDMEYRFDVSVASSFFKRFFLSWLIWNWRIFFIIFVVSEDALASNSEWLNKMDYIEGYYSSWWKNICFFLVGPAITTYISFWILEFFNVISYQVKKYSWKYRINIQNKVEKNTRPTMKMVYDYNDERYKSRKHRMDLEGQLTELENTIKNTKDQTEKLGTEYSYLQKQVFELQNTVKDKQTQEEESKIKAKDICSEIKSSPKSADIFNAFTETYQKIIRNSGSYEISYPTPVLESLVTMGVFSKNDKNEYKVTMAGEHLNRFIQFGSC